MNTKSKRLIIGAAVLTAASLVVPLFGGFAYDNSSSEITFINNTQVETISTNAKTVSQLLEEKGIVLSDEDMVIPSVNSEISDGISVNISSKKPVLIEYGDYYYNDFTAEPVDKDYLKKIGINLDSNDVIINNYDKKTNTLMVKAVSVNEETIEEEEKIEGDVIEIEDDSVYKGLAKITKKGKSGKSKRTYAVRYENGVEVSRILTSEQVLERPTDTVLVVGTKSRPYEVFLDENTKTSTGAPKEYQYVLNVTATAYDLSYASCGKRPGDRGYGITASGMQARYGVIAVDPKVIPLGSKLYIEATDGSWSYGYAVAGDTGGAIKGNRIDLFYNSHSEAIAFGRRNARVYVL